MVLVTRVMSNLQIFHLFYDCLICGLKSDSCCDVVAQPKCTNVGQWNVVVVEEEVVQNDGMVVKNDGVVKNDARRVVESDAVELEETEAAQDALAEWTRV